jgi:hypothetical protein
MLRLNNNKLKNIRDYDLVFFSLYEHNIYFNPSARIWSNVFYFECNNNIQKKTKRDTFTLRTYVETIRNMFYDTKNKITKIKY